MTAQQRWLIVFYALVAFIALVTTWGQNLAYFTEPGGVVGPFFRFVEDAKANPASRSITVDIGFFLLAAAAFMVIEARRLAVRFVWLYIIGGFLIAISVTFPLFMIAREMRAAEGGADAAWRLTPSDLVGLGLVTAAVLSLTWRILN